MPNAKVLSEKQATVAALAEKMKNATSGVLVDYKGITVEDDTKLRSELRKANVDYAAVKNTLVRLAANQIGFEELDGWNGAEVMVLYGLSLMSYAVGASFFFNFSSGLSRRIRSGEFDASLTKPIHPFLHEVFSAGYNVGYVSHFTISLVIIVIALSRLCYTPSPANILLLVLMVLAGSMVQAASLIASSTMSFFTVGNNPVMDFLLWDMKQFTNYPITIFPKGIQFILTFLLPFAFINFYPASALLGKTIPKGYPAVLPWLSPFVGLLVLVLSILLWNWGLSHYKSTGS